MTDSNQILQNKELARDIVKFEIHDGGDGLEVITTIGGHEADFTYVLRGQEEETRKAIALGYWIEQTEILYSSN
jgi:hypothetical protein